METKTRVLIADIDEDFRRLLSDVLTREEDMELLDGTDNGVDALALTAELRPDVIVLDLILLKLDGLEVLKRLPEACPDTKAVIVTHLYRSEIVKQCAALGAAYFIPEPCDVPTLLDRIRQVNSFSRQEPLPAAKPNVSSNRGALPSMAKCWIRPPSRSTRRIKSPWTANLCPLRKKRACGGITNPSD